MLITRSPRFEETEASRDKLRHIAIIAYVRAALRTHVSTSHGYLKVTMLYGRVTLERVVDDAMQRSPCAELACASRACSTSTTA